MSASSTPGSEPPAAEADAPAPPDLTPRVRSIGLVLWCSFLIAAAATMVSFALIDPAALPDSLVPEWWATRRAIYAVGFFFFWGIAAAAAGLTLYMARTEHADRLSQLRRR